MQVVRLKNELASGICCSRGIDAKPTGGVGTLSRAAEVLGGHGLSQVPFWFALSVQFKLSGAIFGLPPAFFLFKTSPFFSSSCHGARCRPVLLLPGILHAVKQVMESNQLLR